MDIPGEKNFLNHLVPKIGGIAIVLGAFTPILIWNNGTLIQAFLISSCIIILFGIVEDFRGLSPKVKLVGQILAALLIVWYGGIQITNLGSLLPDDFMLPVWFSIPLTTAVIVAAINAFKLSDGLDGLAAGTCILIFTGIGYLAYLDGNGVIGIVCLALCGALYGFLRFNTHPASIFMGHSGSQFLGFSASTLAIATTQGHATPLSPVLPLILLGFPLLDTLTVVTSRIARGRSLFVADQNHFHHYLMRFGFGHSGSILVIYFVQTLLLFTAVIFRYCSDWLLLSGYLIGSVLILFCFYRAAVTGYNFKRFHLFDIKITAPIRMLKKKGTVIKWMFPVLEVGIPLLLIVTCLLAKSPPRYINISSGVIACIILIAVLVKSKYLGRFLRLSLYLLVPFAVYFSSETVAGTSGVFVKGYNLSFGFFAVLIILVSTFSHRKQGFQSTPLDFLIVILAILVSNLIDHKIHEFQIGLVAAKTILVYFSFEVLMAELRGKFNKVAWATIVSLLILVVK
jgi:UDP-GlcNAc:undecaprenyl-phosphate GlcNAc-1-phosphate transferase